MEKWDYLKLMINSMESINIRGKTIANAHEKTMKFPESEKKILSEQAFPATKNHRVN